MSREEQSLQTGGTIIYVAGNPDLSPLEYYDAESQTYQGAIPEFLAAFAQAYGYDLRYFQPGTDDRRAELAENQQVDLISGCEAGDRYAHVDGEPLVLFPSQADGEETAYALFLTRVSPASFQADLRAYAARTSQAEWTGAILQSAGETQPQQVPSGLLWGAGLAVLALAVITSILALLLRRREKERGAQDRSGDGLGSLDTLKRAFANIAGGPARSQYSLVCIHLELDQTGRLWGFERARALFLHGAQLLRREAGAGDLAAHCGEDLLLLKRAADPQEVLGWADGVVRQLRDTFPAGLRPQDAAAGVYPLATASHDFQQTLFHVSQCARAACRKGQTCRLCGTDQCRPCQERWELLDDLSDALERNAFQLYVQFFVDAATFRVVGGEALSRWYHPRLGLLNPSRYVPLLEETGQIERLDLYGLEQACGFLEDLRAHQVQDFFISCNFSRMTFSAPDFARRCVQVVQRYTFPRKFLILEVTESQQMASCEMERLRQNIRAVRENGIRVIFDDFGAGFSSFRDLQACPMDGLKLDKELVDHMQTEKGQIILKALVEVGHRMGLTILAEGVEDERQIALLQKLHCDAFQGFRFAVPLPAAEAKSRILRGDRSLQDRAHDPGQTAPPAGSGRESGRRPGKSKEP